MSAPIEDADDYDVDDIDGGEESVTPEKLALVMELSRDLVAREDEVASIEADLKAAKERRDEVATRSLPAALEACGLTVLPLPSDVGIKVEVKKTTVAGITKEDWPDAKKWLVEEGHDDIIKAELAVLFKKDRADLAAKVLEAVTALVKKKDGSVKSNESVHWSTLRSFVREQLDLGTELPESIKWTELMRAEVTRPDGSCGPPGVSGSGDASPPEVSDF